MKTLRQNRISRLISLGR